MKPRHFVLSAENSRVESVRKRACEAINALDLETCGPVAITLEKHNPPRTLAQNAYYWTAMVQPLADYCGYTKDEMHEILLAECFGSAEVGSLTLPNKRSSKLTKAEMQEYLEFVPRFAAEQGVVIGVPDG